MSALSRETRRRLGYWVECLFVWVAGDELRTASAKAVFTLFYDFCGNERERNPYDDTNFSTFQCSKGVRARHPFFYHTEIGPIQNNLVKSFADATTYCTLRRELPKSSPKEMMNQCSAERSDAVLWLDRNPR